MGQFKDGHLQNYLLRGELKSQLRTLFFFLFDDKKNIYFSKCVSLYALVPVSFIKTMVKIKGDYFRFDFY
jgi:hypothetical protein